jgi:hypothetical protein
MTEYVSIGLLCTVIGVAISYVIYTRDKERDNKSEGRQDGVILTEIGYIKSGIDDIKSEQREQRKINTDVYSKLSAVETSAQQAHLRLDRIEEWEYPTHK